MKIIDWRWKNKKYSALEKSYVQREYGNIIELADDRFYTSFPTRVLKKEIEIVRSEEV